MSIKSTSYYYKLYYTKGKQENVTFVICYFYQLFICIHIEYKANIINYRLGTKDIDIYRINN